MSHMQTSTAKAEMIVYLFFILLLVLIVRESESGLSFA